MIIASSLRFNENALDGRPDEYRELAHILRAGQGMLALQTDVDVKPYDVALAEIVVHRTDAELVLMSVAAAGFTIEGPQSFLDKVATAVENATHPHEQKQHIHLDPFPGHFYLDERSAQLIIHDATP